MKKWDLKCITLIDTVNWFQQWNPRGAANGKISTVDLRYKEQV